jgi:secondary thiamine-phosphate synthase enzyme
MRPRSSGHSVHPCVDAMREIVLYSRERCQLIDITDRLQQMVEDAGDGVLVVQSMHTTAALTINENADPDVPHDLLAKLERLIPQRESFYHHAEGNSDSHLKTSFFGPSLMVIVQDGELVLGTWQSVWFCEFDGPRERRVAVQFLAAGGFPSTDR